MKFSDLGLGPEVLRAVADAGYVDPTPIQRQAIPIILMGRDVLGCAQTGTGKTAGFTLPMIEILASGRAKARMPRSLILEPTRELAAQVAESFAVYGKHHKLTTALLIGGTSIADQQRLLDRGVDVLIATPGRLLDLFERGKLLLNDVRILVIDECDRMLDMGFIPDVQRICRLLPKIRQTVLFSATVPAEVRHLADEFLINPKEISVALTAVPAEMVDHALAMVAAGQKHQALRRLIRAEEVDSALIFCNRKRDIATVVRELKRHGLAASALHGDMPQPVRMETLDAFKKGDIAILVASDVAGRGLDITGLSHVFNYDVPEDPEAYIHRIGRTGRAGRRGRAITLVTPRDRKYIEAIVKLIGQRIDRVEVPGLEKAVPEEGAEGDGRGRGRRGRGAGKAQAKARGKETGGKGKRPKKAKAEPAKPRPSEKTRGGRRQESATKGRPRGEATGLGDHVPAFLLKPVPIKPGGND
jgi:superfamily II DNA/RNA helicase